MRIAAAILGAAMLGLALLPLPAAAQPRKVDAPHVDQTIGSWLLSCTMDPMTDAQQCRMRGKLWLVVPDDSHPGLALEVVQRYDLLVPVLTVRNISFTTALSGLLTLTGTAEIRFDANPLIALPCTLEGSNFVICAPVKADAATAAEQLVQARTVLVRLRPIGNLPFPVPDEPMALDLDRTAEALARYRLAGPAVPPTPESFGQDIKGLADRMMRRFGLTGSDTPPAK